MQAGWMGKPIPDRVAKRAHDNVAVDEETGCWVSTYSRQRAGYAVLNIKDAGQKPESFLAHRASWTHANGPIPAGMTVDHLCRNRACVNPEHLRLLSNSDNARRQHGRDWPLGQCRQGHPDSDRELVVWAGKSRMMCRPCQDEKNRILAERQKAERAARKGMAA